MKINPWTLRPEPMVIRERLAWALVRLGVNPFVASRIFNLRAHWRKSWAWERGFNG